MSRVLLLAAVVTVACCLGSSTRAQDQPPAAPDAAQLFEQLDANKDGQLARDEVSPERRRLFERLLRTADKDGNGTLSKDEFVAGMAANPRPATGAAAPAGGQPERPRLERLNPDVLFARLDRNGDGKITRDELPQERREFLERVLARADRDGDQAITKQELADSLEAISRGLRGDGGPDGGPNADRIFERLDANKDGKLTVDEAPEFLRERFAQLIAEADKNGDKALDKEEFKAGGGQVLRRLARRAAGGQPGEPGQPTSERPAVAAAGGRRFGLMGLLDADHDGKLSASEIEGAAAALKKLDKNGDGVVDRDELREVFSGGGPGVGPRPEGGRPPSVQ